MKELNKKDQDILKELILCVGKNIPKVSNLIEIDLGYISKGGKITGLRLSQSDLIELPKSIGSLPSLKELNLSNSKNLKKINPSILKLKSLSSLDLSFCDIDEFPRKSIFSMVHYLDNLEKLNIVGLSTSSDTISKINKVLLTNFEDISINPEKIIQELQSNIISKENALNALISMIDNYESSYIRVKAIESLSTLDSDRKFLFDFFQQLFLSDDNPLIKVSVGKILISKYLYESIEILEGDVEKEIDSLVYSILFQLIKQSKGKLGNRLRKKIIDTYASFHKISPEEIEFFLDLYYLLFKKRRISYELYSHISQDSIIRNPLIHDYWRLQLNECLDYDYGMDNGIRVYRAYKHVILLNIGGYGLMQIPNSISLLRKLRYLSLGYNRFKSLPLSIGELKNLHELNLRYNHFTDLPKFLENLPKLESLLLSGNPISKSPTIISELKVIKILDLYNTPMTSASESIRKIAEKYYAPYYINQGVDAHDATILGLCEIFIGKHDLQHNKYFEKELMEDGIIWYGCPDFSYVLNESGNITLLGLGMGYENVFKEFRCPEEVCNLPKLEKIWFLGGRSPRNPDLDSIREFNKEQTERYGKFIKI